MVPLCSPPQQECPCLLGSTLGQQAQEVPQDMLCPTQVQEEPQWTLTACARMALTQQQGETYSRLAFRGAQGVWLTEPKQEWREWEAGLTFQQQHQLRAMSSGHELTLWCTSVVLYVVIRTWSQISAAPFLISLCLTTWITLPSSVWQTLVKPFPSLTDNNVLRELFDLHHKGNSNIAQEQTKLPAPYTHNLYKMCEKNSVFYYPCDFCALNTQQLQVSSSQSQSESSHENFRITTAIKCY